MAGLPVPGGSKRAFPYRGKDGKTHVAVSDASGDRVKHWRAAVQFAAQQAWKFSPFEGPVILNLLFVLPRVKGHWTPGGTLRRNAPPWHTKKPDVLKLTRAVEDCLTGVVWKDDAQIVDEHIVKFYGRRTGVEIIVRPAMLRDHGALELKLRLLDRVAEGKGRAEP